MSVKKHIKRFLTAKEYQIAVDNNTLEEPYILLLDYDVRKFVIKNNPNAMVALIDEPELIDEEPLE